MSDKIDFRIRFRKTEYGDRRKFVEYRIHLCRHNRVVGAEDGPRRMTKTRAEALRAARARVDVLRRHRLFVIRVTNKHIRDGEARSCSSCAIAQALWHNQERMGFEKSWIDFRVEPYAGWFTSARGIMLQSWGNWDYDNAPRIEPDDLPSMVWHRARIGRVWPESMVEWAMHWDDWAQARNETRKEYAERTGDDEGKPSRPVPMSFVLDLDMFQTGREGALP